MNVEDLFIKNKEEKNVADPTEFRTLVLTDYHKIIFENFYSMMFWMDYMLNMFCINTSYHPFASFSFMLC